MCLVHDVADKTNRGIIVGMLPRSHASHHTLSKAIGINERIKKLCCQKKVNFLDLWQVFVGKRQYFGKDGTHLSKMGQRKLGDILGRECEKMISSDRSGDKDSPSETPTPQIQEVPEEDNCENSFVGFPQGNE